MLKKMRFLGLLGRKKALWYKCGVLGVICLNNTYIRAQEKISLTLEKAMEMSLSSSRAKMKQEYEIQILEDKKDQTVASMLPSLTWDSQHVWINDSVNKAVGKTMGTTKVPDVIQKASLTIAQPLVVLGPLYMKLQTDLEQISLAKERLKDSQIQGMILGAEGMIQYQKALEFLEISKASLVVAQKQKSDAAVLVRAGRLASSDELKFDFFVAEAESQVNQAQMMVNLSKINLADILGTSLDIDFEIVKSKGDTFFNPDPFKIKKEELLEKVLNTNIGIKAIKAGMTMTEYLKKASDFDYFPMVNAFIRFERDFMAEDISTLNAQKRPVTLYKKEDIQNNLSYGLQVNWKIWDWNSRAARSREFAHTLEKTKIELEDLESKIKLGVSKAFLDLTLSAQNIEKSKTSVKLADENYRVANQRFMSGQLSPTDLISAERDHTRAKGGLTNARADLDLAWLSLLKVMGEQPQIKN